MQSKNYTVTMSLSSLCLIIASTLLLISTIDAAPISYASNFIATDFIDIPQEGIRTQCTMFYESGKQMLKNCSSTHGYYTTLYIIAQKAAYTIYPGQDADGANTQLCIVQSGITSPLPPVPIAPQLPLYRSVLKAIYPEVKTMNEYRYGVGKYFLTMYADPNFYSDPSNSSPTVLDNYDAMAEVKSSTFKNDTKAPASYFAVPDSCKQGHKGLKRVVKGLMTHQVLDTVVTARRRQIGLAPGHSEHDLFAKAAKNSKTVLFHQHPAHAKLLNIVPPKEMDNRRYANPPRNQGVECGSCWTFASTGLAETVYNFARKQAADPNAPNYLSVQAIIDCVHTNISHGCFGGAGMDALDFIAKGIPLEVDYPYQAVGGFNCPLGPNSNSSFKAIKPISANLTLIYPWNETQVMQAIATYGAVLGGQKELVSGPLVNQSMYYSGGVYNNPSCSADLPGGHVIEFIGWGTDASSGLDYWLIRNSLGNGWGEGGFFRVARGNNMCGTEEGAWVARPRD